MKHQQMVASVQHAPRVKVAGDAQQQQREGERLDSIAKVKRKGGCENDRDHDTNQLDRPGQSSGQKTNQTKRRKVAVSKSFENSEDHAGREKVLRSSKQRSRDEQHGPDSLRDAGTYHRPSRQCFTV